MSSTSGTAKNNRTYGFNAEAELLQWLRDRELTSERLHLAGNEDEGDLIVLRTEDVFDEEVHHWFIVQLKTFAARSKTGAERPLTPGRIKGWLRDLDAQREAYRAHRGLSEAPGGILVVKFKGTSWDDALVINSLGRWAS